MKYATRLGAAILAAVIITGFSACSLFLPNQDQPTNNTSGPAATGSGGSGGSGGGSGPGGIPADYGTAVADTSTVMAQATSEVGSTSSTNNPGGTITGILRAVEVRDQLMVIRYAVRWDNQTADDDTSFGLDALGVNMAMMIAIDRASLTGYRPLCTSGAWHDEYTWECRNNLLVIPEDPYAVSFFQLPNHALLEGYAIMPAPTGKPKVLDISLGDGMPLFTDATVTYH